MSQREGERDERLLCSQFSIASVIGEERKREKRNEM